MKSFVVKLANLVGETGLYQYLCPNRLPVFMLHRITDGPTTLPGTMPAETLRGYLKYLADRRYRVLSMGELLSILEGGQDIPRKAVVFTIDDGFHDHHDLAAAIFDEFGFPLNFFLITDLLDGKLWPWDDQITYAMYRTQAANVSLKLPSGREYHADSSTATARTIARELRNLLKGESQEHIYEWLKTELYPKLGVEYPGEIPSEYRPMSWDDARSLHSRGHGVFPHTCSHRILTTLPLREKQREIQQSFERVGSELVCTPEVFAYPTGRLSDYDHTDIEELKKSGVRMAFNTVPDYVHKGQHLFELSRFSLPSRRSEFLQIVNRFEAVNRAVNRQPELLINFLPTR